MKTDFLARAKELVSLDTVRKASALTEGDYLSARKSRSLEFDELSEYRPGDNVHDIDWKATSRTGRVLVRRYMAFRRHNVMIVGDCGLKMTGHTPSGELKGTLAVTTLAFFGELFSRLGADCALADDHNGVPRHSGFSHGSEFLAGLTAAYQEDVEGESASPLNRVLAFVENAFRREMIVVVITDRMGLLSLDEKVLNRLCYRNDLMVINIEDAPLCGDGSFDVTTGRYADTFLLKSDALAETEEKIRSEITERVEKLLASRRGGLVTVSREEELPDAVISLFRKLYTRNA